MSLKLLFVSMFVFIQTVAIADISPKKYCGAVHIRGSNYMDPQAEDGEIGYLWDDKFNPYIVDGTKDSKWIIEYLISQIKDFSDRPCFCIEGRADDGEGGFLFEEITGLYECHNGRKIK